MLKAIGGVFALKKKILFIIFMALLFNLVSCNSVQKEMGNQVDNEKTDTGETNTPDQDHKPIEIEYYKNPILKTNDTNTWQNYGVGDPFVMRYNGRYYLYCSTKDGQVGIQCWISDNLVDWVYSGLCATEALTKSAYAPEVVYYNGSFYMYTSPAGNGHYVLKSASPTGPFVAVTGNFGLSIDGNVFIDDDGSWYFYSAASDGIMVYSMSAPDKVDAGSGKKILCDMNGWTEGSMIVKHDGLYYMTYTGNHVWTAGYRINYAVSDKSPLAFERVDNNPLLLSTDKKTVMGIGHSSTVLGPNLDEYYIVYHSFKTVPMRNMNIDRIVFNGTGTVVLGATTDKQQVPAMPDLYARFEREDELSPWNITSGGFENGSFMLSEGGKVLSKQVFEGDFTAEINLKSISSNAGILFGYRDEKNYAKAVFDLERSALEICFVKDGQADTKSVPISASFSDALSTEALISFTVRKSGAEYTIFVNNREVFSTESELSGGAIGVICESGTANLGFVGVTNGALQSTLSEVYKPVENIIPAFACTNDAKETKLYEKAQYLVAATGNSYEYKVNVSDKGSYDMVIEYRSSKACVLEVYQNGTRIGDVSLEKTNEKLRRVSGRQLDLAAGLGTITLCVKEGNVDLLDFSFHAATTVTEKVYDFEKSMSYTYIDGYWRRENGSLALEGDFGKYMVGSENWGNYVVESDIIITSDSANAGLCVRVSNPATHLENQLSEGSDYLQGYFIGLGDDSVILGKHNYNWQELNRVSFNTQIGKTYHFKVEVEENVIRISVDGKQIMTYKDNDAPFLHGMVGYRAHASSMRVDNLTISPID